MNDMCAEELMLSLDDVVQMFKDEKFKKIRVVALLSDGGIMEFEFVNQDRLPATS